MESTEGKLREFLDASQPDIYVFFPMKYIPKNFIIPFQGIVLEFLGILGQSVKAREALVDNQG